ncbi:hypothetical protein KP509_1Z197100 [Ceratopteris richardii]|nr:hypothetical protein KP509_1Z197100 [Ceratopteris richardii]
MTSLRGSSSERFSLLCSPLLWHFTVPVWSQCQTLANNVRAIIKFSPADPLPSPSTCTTPSTTPFNSICGLPPNISFPNPYTLGVMNTFEDPITSGPSNTSAPLGKAQGFYLLNSFNKYTLFHVFTANITEGDYKGTIAIFGQVREVDPIRYLTVIGGTGSFLGARGLAKNRLIDIDHAPPAKWTMSFELDLYY